MVGTEVAWARGSPEQSQGTWLHQQVALFLFTTSLLAKNLEQQNQA